ncbi:MAG: hypothetical protein MJZ75_03090 [Paludibacteraceae bacterium]|nr:hypothetical protein [Paludibacteraceae bacterium]
MMSASMLHDLWEICKKEETIRDCMKDNITAFLLEIPPEALDSKHAKQRSKALKELK